MAAKHCLGEVKAGHCRAVHAKASRQSARNMLQLQLPGDSIANRVKMNGWLLFYHRHRDKSVRNFAEPIADFQSRVRQEASDMWAQSTEDVRQDLRAEAEQINASAKSSYDIAVASEHGEPIWSTDLTQEEIVNIKIDTKHVVNDVRIEPSDTPWCMGSGRWPISVREIDRQREAAHTAGENFVSRQSEAWSTQSCLPVEEEDDIVSKHYTKRLLCSDLFGEDHCLQHTERAKLKSLWTFSRWVRERAQSLTNNEAEGHPLFHIHAETEEETHLKHFHWFCLVLHVSRDKGKHATK